MIRVDRTFEDGLPVVTFELDGTDSSDQRLRVEKIYARFHKLALSPGCAVKLDDIREFAEELLAGDALRKLVATLSRYAERLFVREIRCRRVPLGTSYDGESVVGICAEFQISPRKPAEVSPPGGKKRQSPVNTFLAARRIT